MLELCILCVAMNLLWAFRSVYLGHKFNKLKHLQTNLKRENQQLKTVINLLAHECIEVKLNIDEKKQYLEKCLKHS
jgi:L-ribulose-5-phosphate 3-epimerase UlaE